MHHFPKWHTRSERDIVVPPGGAHAIISFRLSAGYGQGLLQLLLVRRPSTRFRRIPARHINITSIRHIRTARVRSPANAKQCESGLAVADARTDRQRGADPLGPNPAGRGRDASSGMAGRAGASWGATARAATPRSARYDPPRGAGYLPDGRVARLPIVPLRVAPLPEPFRRGQFARRRERPRFNIWALPTENRYPLFREAL